MKRFATILALLQLCVLSVRAAETPKACTTCVGVTLTAAAPAPAVPVPAFVHLASEDLPSAGSWIVSLSPEQRKLTTVIVSFSAGSGDAALGDVDQTARSIVDWARQHGPFGAFGADARTPDAAVAAYAVKRVAVLAQGEGAGERMAIQPADVASLDRLFGAGAGAYVDDVVVDEALVAPVAAWLVEHDPSKKIQALVHVASPNPLYDGARALAAGAQHAYLDSPAADVAAAVASLDANFTGDWAFDSTNHPVILDAKGQKLDLPVVAFVRGEDLRTMFFARGAEARAIILSVPASDMTAPKRIDATGVHPITDAGHGGDRLLVGIANPQQPHAVTLDHQEKPAQNVTKEAIDVATHRGITVEEIIRNHQAFRAFQDSIATRYIARNATGLRFGLGDGGDAFEATVAGDYFVDPGHGADWVWSDLYVNGVRWKYGRIPELPLIQAEKVTQLPLDLHLTNDYRYELVRETDLLGYHTYEVRFEPPPNAPDGLPLYRGTVWIDAKTWARVRISMVQLHMTGEVLSNEERIDFLPFSRDTRQPVDAAAATAADGHDVLWLTSRVDAQQVISVNGRANVVLRSTEFSKFRIDPPDFDQLRKEAHDSNSRMVRESEKEGLQYLEKNKEGERVLRTGFRQSRTFLLGGLHHDEGLEYPVVPLGGVDYFNFNLANRGLQTNVFFAGVIVAANLTDPNVGNTQTNVGADFFGIAVPFTNSMFRNGVEQTSEAVKALPLNLYFRAGHPLGSFGKVDVSLQTSHISYQRSQDTAPDFQVPSDTFVLAPGISAQYARWGYTLSAYYDYSRRTKWEPWGNLAEYDPSQKSFTDFGASFGKSFYLPKFQRLGVELDYIDGQRLDRFSKYELGFFGSQRVHGIRSGSVRAESAVLGHLSYGFVISDQLRLEAFYDHALVDDTTAGYHRTPFQGVGLGGQTVGPWGTILRLDLGKTVGQNRQDGFVANVVFLKLF